jgi:hypothetical protein
MAIPLVKILTFNILKSYLLKYDKKMMYNRPSHFFMQNYKLTNNHYFIILQ